MYLWFFRICYQRRQWHPTPVLLPGKSHGRRSLVGCSPWGCKESDTTEWLHFHFSLSCIREGNGNPLQGSCLENPRDGGAWWAAVYGVAQSQTQLKWLSSSSMCYYKPILFVLYLFHTWDIGGHVDGCGWPETFDSAGSYEKLVGGSWMEMHEDMVGTVP